MGGPETVLVLEDEPQLLKLMARVLERAGYAVVRASHGDEALRLLRDPDRAIPAAVIDMAIPPAGARSLLDILDPLCKDLAVVVTSGDLIDPELSASLERRRGVFLRKPFVPQALVQALEEAARARRETAGLDAVGAATGESS